MWVLDRNMFLERQTNIKKKQHTAIIKFIF